MIKNDVKNIVLTFRISPLEKRNLTEYCGRYNRSISEVIRNLMSGVLTGSDPSKNGSGWSVRR